MSDFLFEVGLEEVPARMLASAEAELSRRMTDLLTRERLLGEGGSVESFSTPRRLAVLVRDVLLQQPDTGRGTARTPCEGGLQGRQTDSGG